jgi:23S rRNA (adenine2503-C2)-methyltransferase
MPTAITELSLSDLEDLVCSCGEAKYRARQLARGIYRSQALGFEELAYLPLGLREKLSQNFWFESLDLVTRAVSSDRLTEKFLFRFKDSRTIETVAMYYPASATGRRRCTLCLSTQVGCAIGCPFCATGRQGFERNLSSGEIIDQVLYFARRLARQDDAAKITNIVFMGMGEPLANYEAVWQAIERLNVPWGFSLGSRHFTISTIGLVPQIKRLSRERLQVGLAISLHAADNALRDKLVPINKTYPLEVLLPACQEYVDLTGRRISFEYALFRGLNDSLEQARKLGGLLRGLNCHVNLIPANINSKSEYEPSSRKQVAAFRAELERCHVKATIRAERGDDIEAGCGQLRSKLCIACTKKA